MALNSAEMRDLYDLKVFVVSRILQLGVSGSSPTELRLRLDVGSTY